MNKARNDFKRERERGGISLLLIFKKKKLYIYIYYGNDNYFIRTEIQYYNKMWHSFNQIWRALAHNMNKTRNDFKRERRNFFAFNFIYIYIYIYMGTIAISLELRFNTTIKCGIPLTNFEEPWPIAKQPPPTPKKKKKKNYPILLGRYSSH